MAGYAAIRGWQREWLPSRHRTSPWRMRPDERLDYFLTRRGVGTWAEVRTLIQCNQVHVNAAVCKHYHRLLTASDVITVKGRLITDAIDSSILVYNKPRGLACSHDPHDKPLVYDHLPVAYHHPNLQTVGRLDRDTTGLLILTIDGIWAQRIVAPEHTRWKRYHIIYSGTLIADAEARVEDGLALTDDIKPCLPGYLLHGDNTTDGLGQATIIICEGRHHQVKRMISTLGGHVQQLHRDRIGGLNLPTDVVDGACRPLSLSEEQQLFALERQDPQTWKSEPHR